MSEKHRYLVGIDVGSYSVGMTAVAVDEEGTPTELLSSVSHIHDSGLDPDSIKSAQTRLAVSGVARRTRRLFRRRRRRLVQLDNFLEKQGWPVNEMESYEDPYLPWRVRAELVVSRIENSAERGEKLSIALRHIARHRGWRNPYTKVSSLMADVSPSEAFNEIRTTISKTTGITIPETATVGQMVAATSFGQHKLRGEGGLLSARLQQSDHAREIREICAKQGIEPALTREIIEKVFVAESPKGSASGRVGKDPLQPGKRRALKASDAFQRYRIAALIGNLRIRTEDGKRLLTLEERNLINDHLLNLKPKVEPDWNSIAEILGIDRGRLLGTATMTDDGERAGARPPVHDTNRQLLTCSVKTLANWWKEADDTHRAAMLKALANGEMDDFDSPEGAVVQEFFANLDDAEQEKLDKLHLPMGRAAYSEDTLRRITRVMLDEGVDLYEARRRAFGVNPDWKPPAPRIGEPVGNPAVDRVLKTVARWLESAIDTWGIPESVNIEHVRDAFISESKSRELDRDIQRRTKRNEQLFAEMQQKLGIEASRTRRADLWRYQSVQRQNGQCAYCGQSIRYDNCEMDHIVPRAGAGSTNIRANLVAVCGRCNRSKSNIPFAVWAERCDREGVSVAEAKERTRHWITDPGMRPREFKEFTAEVCKRLERATVDEELDNRSIESVAWMANELRARIWQHLQNEDGDSPKVRVYRGSLTAAARKASGISKRLEFIGGTGKTRLDRRHHAVDAAVVALMSATVAEVLAQRENVRFSQELCRSAPQWKEFTGSDAHHQIQFSTWRRKMKVLAGLLQEALNEDRIVVMSNLRLRLGNGAVHEDTIRPLKELKVGDAISVQDIDRASSEALWCALTRHPDFDPKEGLPEDPDRTIRIHGNHLNSDDTITVFPIGAASLAVRGGFAELGSSFHHARIYRYPAGKKMAYGMMRVYTIDLQKFREQDLFSVELPPQTITRRYTEPKLRQALDAGTAEYLGWLVIDDELLVKTDPFNTGHLAQAQEEVGIISRWRLDGFYSDSKLRLRPLQLSGEGLSENASEGLCKTVDRPGWRPAVNKFFERGAVVVIRRDALGRPRMESPAHLPVTWLAGA
ncbi:HNH endonuclease [Corynebacterium sp. CCM 9185]|uniref:HNH endonuclease n=1 Tax=Corynebacterium marambiense TaxID=2765364 RepID=A0ABS0VYD0_9CORY|nr:type II CRISPR RNA-guided endonuclease Cas9 [Corynebacterium marambiense]MBI9001416.1 HNH endonuclease [Corynebacterium marambiense]MCK7664059.1 HNH endonuclease [Corynebacterium marambiense]